MSSVSSRTKPFNLFAFPFGSGQINSSSYDSVKQRSFISFRGVPEDNVDEPCSHHYSPPGSLEHRPPTRVQLSSLASSFEIVKATREPFGTIKPTLKRLRIPNDDDIEEIQPFTPGYTNKLQGWSTSCRNSPVIDMTPKAGDFHDQSYTEKGAGDQTNAPTLEKTKMPQAGPKDTRLRPRTLSTHQVDAEALTQLQDVRQGDQTLLVIMDQSAQDARQARRHDDTYDQQALKLQGFLTT
jgi:hypothetical protein